MSIGSKFYKYYNNYYKVDIYNYIDKHSRFKIMSTNPLSYPIFFMLLQCCSTNETNYTMNTFQSYLSHSQSAQ